MPYIGDGLETFGETQDRTTTPTLGVQQSVSNQMAAQEYSPLTNLLGYAIGGVVDLADTVGSSVASVTPGVDLGRGEVNQAVLRFADSPGLNRWYNDNKSGLEVASGVAGIVASELAVRRFAGPTSGFMRAMRETPYLRRIAILDEQAANAANTVNQLSLIGARRGLTGTELARVEAQVATKAFNPATGAFDDALLVTSRNTALRNAKLYSAAAGARHAAATEAVMALTLNQNGFLYDDSMAWNLAFAGGGIGIGAGVNAISVGYRARSFANSDLVRRAVAGALDPEGVEGARLGWKGIFNGPKTNKLDAGDWLGGSITDRITDLNINVAKLREARVPDGLTDDPRTILENRNKLANQWEQKVAEEVNKVTSKGISTDGFTRFNDRNKPQWDHVQMMLKRDPGALNLVEMVGAIPSGKSANEVIDGHFLRIEERLNEAERVIDDLTKAARESGKPLTKKQLEIVETQQSLMRRLAYERELVPMASVDGEWMPLSEVESLHGWEEPKIRATTHDADSPGARIFLETESEAPGGGVTLDSNLTLTLPGKRNLDNADHFDVLRAYRLADQMLNRLTSAKQTVQVVVPENASWFQLDMVEEAIRRNANVDVVWQGSRTRESAQVESLVQKARALAKQRIYDTGMKTKLAEKGKSYSGRLSALRVRYNLPRMTALERGVMGTEDSPIDMLMRGIESHGFDAAEKMSLDEIKKSVADFKRLGDFVGATEDDLASLYGSSFKYMMNHDGSGALAPLVALRRNFSYEKWTADSVAERMAARKMRTVGVMTAPDAGGLTKSLTESITSTEDFHLASRTDELSDIQLQGSIFGSMPGTGLGAASRAIKTSEHIGRDSPALIAAIRLRDTVSRITRDKMRMVIDTAFGDNLKLLSNPRNSSSKLLLNQFHSLRSGWDLEAKAVKLDDGHYAFKLGDTAANRKRWEATRQTPWSGEHFLESVDGRRVVLDELGMQIQNAFNAVTTQLVGEKNTLLRSMGRQQINVQHHYVPPANVESKHIGFVMGPDNRVVPDFTIIEDTESGFQAAKDALIKRMDELPNGGMGYVFRTQDEIRRFATIWDRAEMDMLNPNLTAIQPSKKAKGALVGREVKLDAFENSLRYLQEQYLTHGNDVMRTLMKEQIDSATARAQITGNTVRGPRGETTKSRSIHDYYLENLLGKNKLNHPASLVGMIYNGIEKPINTVLADATVKASTIWDATRTYLGQSWRIWDRSETVKKDFDALTERLGDYMPFKTAAEYAARKEAGVDPLTIGKIGAKVNQISAALMLRILEVGHPIMNLAGVVNSMPSVIRHLQPLAGENAAEHARRVGWSSTVFQSASGDPIAIPDMVKLGRRAFARAWDRKSHPDFDFMVGRGYLSQEVAEFHRQFSSIETPGKLTQWASQATEKLSVLSDKSEDFSRSWGHMIGLELADLLKLEGRETRHAFAHDIANKMIANYNPANRPEIFQGAMGAPLGLFQSFVQNYYQRLFRYIETKDVRSFATQYAMQSALFGVTGLAGFKEAMGALEWVSGEEGHPAGQFLGHGVLGAIPRMFGVPGVDFAARGDVSVRVPGVGSQDLPGMAVAKKLYSGVTAGISLFSDAYPTLTRTQVAEIASNMVVNRPLSGLIEQFAANGVDTDDYGQVVTDTRNWMETTYRMLGLRSQRQAAELEAFYTDKDAAGIKAALDDKLRMSTRAAMRQGNFSALPQIFEKYIENGGKPSQFRRWVKENYESATTTRAERQLDKLLKNPAYFDRAQRMMDMGVTIDESELYSDDNMKALKGQANDLVSQYNAQEALKGEAAFGGGGADDEF